MEIKYEQPEIELITLEIDVITSSFVEGEGEEWENW